MIWNLFTVINDNRHGNLNINSIITNAKMKKKAKFQKYSNFIRLVLKNIFCENKLFSHQIIVW